MPNWMDDWRPDFARSCLIDGMRESHLTINANIARPVVTSVASRRASLLRD